MDLPRAASEWLWVSGLLWVACAVAFVVLRSRIRGRPRLASAVVGGLSLWLTFNLLEVGCRVFLAVPFGIPGPVASTLWYDRYWKPINGEQVRDIAIDRRRRADRPRMLVVGDSVAAGWGIEDPNDRFVNRLRRALGESWSVGLLAAPGWGTAEQLAKLASSRRPRPDLVVLQYNANDVLGVASAAGLFDWREAATILAVRPAWVEPVVRNSHVANFIYWAVFPPLDRLADLYRDLLERSLADERVWAAHMEELTKLADWTHDAGGRLVVMLSPELGVIPTDALRERVAKHVALLGGDVVDGARVLDGRTRDSLVVNRFDTHPNEEAHAALAALLLERLDTNLRAIESIRQRAAVRRR